MSTPITVLGGAAIGMAVGSLIVPFTRRALAASVARASSGESVVSTIPTVGATEAETPPRMTTRQWAVLVVVSGLLPAYVLHKVGWTIIAFPPLLLLVGLVQLAYCDLTRRLLPKTMVYALTGAVVGSGIIIAGILDEWGRLKVASLGGLVFFAFLFIINLINPRWLAYGDVRLSFVVGFGLAWVSFECLIECLFLANLLAVFVGLGLIAAHKAERGSAVPYGLYLAIGAALALCIWS
jgi:prepilin signal peptidase PulO-like enzyme (type II secretory pathway)